MHGSGNVSLVVSVAQQLEIVFKGHGRPSVHTLKPSWNRIINSSALETLSKEVNFI